MDLNTDFELVFGILTTIIALLGLWLTFKYRDGTLPIFDPWSIQVFHTDECGIPG
jgi:hypothetical protein